MCLEGALFRDRWPLLGGVTTNSNPLSGVSESSALSSRTVISVTEPAQTWEMKAKVIWHFLPFIQSIEFFHPQSFVGCNDRRLIIDRCNVDVNSAGQAVLPGFCLIGHDGEAVCLGFAAIMNVGDVLVLHLKVKEK